MRSNISEDAEPLVTIAVPTLDRAVMLRRCVKSALAQTGANVEVLVSDNASSDDTQGALAELADPRLRILTQPSRVPMSEHWNLLLEASRGTFFVLLSDDDRVAPGFISAILRTYESEPSAAFVYGHTVVTDDASAYSYPGGTRSETGEQFVVRALTQDYIVHLCSVVFRTNDLRSIGGFPTDLVYATDTAALAQLALRGNPVIHCPSAVSYYNLQSGSITNVHSLEAHIVDYRRLIDLCISAAHRLVGDESADVAFRRAGNRFLARSAASFLFRQVARGGSRLTLLRSAWKYRSCLAGDPVFAAARIVPGFICPRKLANGLKRLKRSLFKQHAALPVEHTC